MAGTMYVILKAAAIGGQVGHGNPVAWEEIGEQAAGSPEAAVKAFLNANDNGDKFGEGSYRGVAERSWGEPVSIQKKISFG